MNKTRTSNLLKAGILSICVFIITGCANYGEKMEFNRGEVYYKPPIMDSEARKLGEYLVENGFFDGTPKSIQLIKPDDTYTIRFVIKKGLEKDDNIIDSLKQISAFVSSDIFDEEPVDVHICNNAFETISEIKGISYGRSLKFDGDILYYKEPISTAKAVELGNYLKSIGVFINQGAMMMLTKDSDIFRLHLIIEEVTEVDDGFLENVRIVAEAISKDVFSGDRINIHLCDQFFNTNQVVSSAD